ncbi:MAG TPA: phage terminase large subunit [Verrucomicrobiae bacterium]|nr:phage terminase large subunit [Verrucomicrobiae bacterium]
MKRRTREDTQKAVRISGRLKEGRQEKAIQREPKKSYDPFPRQKEFHDSEAKYRLFGGAAGPGKTRALLEEAFVQAKKHRGSDSLLLRRTYSELESSLIAQFRRHVPRSEYRSYNEAKHLLTLTNGSTIRFGYCRNENDVYQYQGAEFLFIGIDELTHFTLKQWQFLTSRNRCPIPGTFPCMAGATNPGNIGHAWVKALWVDKTPPPGFERPEQYDRGDYDFIRARIADNPIYANDLNYRKTLEALPEQLRKAFLDGDWDVLSGQYFDLFEIGRHTARPEELGMQAWWPRWISIDWGFQHPSAVYWHCAMPKKVASGEWRVARAKRDPSTAAAKAAASARDDSFGLGADGAKDGTTGRIVTYREFVQNGLSPRMLGQAIAERCKDEKIQEIYLSPDAFAHRTSEASIAEQLGEVLAANGLPRPSQADDDRIGGWQLMYQLLEQDAWVITENCGKLIECLPQLVRDTRRVEDVRKAEGDDPADAARYGIVPGARYAGVGASARGGPGAGQAPPLYSQVRFMPGMPLGEQIARQVTAEDATSRAIQFQRLEAEARKQFGPQRLPRRRWNW